MKASLSLVQFFGVFHLIWPHIVSISAQVSLFTKKSFFLQRMESQELVKNKSYWKAIKVREKKEIDQVTFKKWFTKGGEVISIGLHEDSFQLVGSGYTSYIQQRQRNKKRQRQRFSQYAFAKDEPFTVLGGGSMALQWAGDSASLDKRGRRCCSQLDLDTILRFLPTLWFVQTD